MTSLAPSLTRTKVKLVRVATKILQRIQAFRRRTSDAEVIRQSALFETGWYRRKYPDTASVDPVLHYLKRGARLGYDPSPSFSTTRYREKYADVVASGLNPLVHFILFGRAEGRDGERHDYDVWVERFDRLTDADREEIRRAIELMPARPLISVLVPAYNTDE